MRTFYRKTASERARKRNPWRARSFLRGAAHRCPMAENDLLEHIGKTLILFASIALVTILAFVFLAVFSLVESSYSIPLTNLVDGLVPATLLSIIALISGTVALVASKIAGSTKMNPPPQ